MQISLLPLELPRWDQAAPGDALCVPLWTDVRPLRGAAGLLDWRLCGRLSAMLASGKVTGREGEQTLFPTGQRLPWRLVLALGGGPRRDFSDKRFAAGVRQALGALKGLSAKRLAIALPGRDGERAATGAAATLTSRRALDLLLEAVDETPGLVDDLTVLAPASVQKELGEVLRLRAVRAAAPKPAPRRAARKG
ncbi:MAG TPA: M17 family peptidase N-terminal domain-containing protein [Polyangia bacterium]|nr:M17 family peptidase N-terminal domain-containing protein [Polyangia bacterium]